MRRLLIALTLSLTFVGMPPTTAEDAPAPTGPRVEQAWRPLPAIAGDTFRFLVMADNQPHGDPERVAQTEVFRRIVEEANRLSPDLVLMAGDLIYGYEGDPGTVHRMWDAFDAATAKLEAPYRMAPGNHCIWDARSAGVWAERYGPLYHAFTVGGCRFLALNSEESYGTRDRLSPRQIAWIETEVEAAKTSARHLFVYIHKPLWRFEPGRGPWMEQVHPILARHPSVTVFAGHFHVYERSRDRDGVRYYVAPAAGGPIGRVEAAGEFHGYLQVTVRGPDVRVAVIRPGAVLSDEYLREDRREAFFQTARSIRAEPVVFGTEPSREIERKLSLENHLAEPLAIEVMLEIPEGCSWTMPTTALAKTVAPGEEAWFPIRLTPGAEPFPTPRYHVVGRSGETLMIDREGIWPVIMDRRLEVARASAAVTLDGVLDEPAWRTARPAGRFLRLTGDAYAGRRTTWQALWDDERLYFAFELAEPDMGAIVTQAPARDWMMVTDDAVVFYVDVARDGKTRFCFGVNAAGVPMEYAAPGGAVNPGWSGPWSSAVRKRERGWTIELSIPWASLGFEPAAGRTFAVGAYRKTNPGDGEISGWTVPVAGRLSDPAGFGEAVLK